PCQSTSSQSPPASRTIWHTHSPARSTSSPCAGSALTDSMRRSSASSSNQGVLTAGEPTDRARSIDLGHERLLLDRGPDVGLLGPRGQFERRRSQILVVDLREQVGDA